MKEVVRAARSQGAKIASRVIDAPLADACMARIEALESEIDAILKMEREERALGAAERDVRKGENLVEFEADIKGRPKRTWFATGREKETARERGWRELNGVSSAAQGPQSSKKGNDGKEKGKEDKGKGKLSNNQKKALDAKREMRDGGRVWKKGKGDSNQIGKGAVRAGKGTTGKGKTKGKKMSSGISKVKGKGRGKGKAKGKGKGK